VRYQFIVVAGDALDPQKSPDERIWAPNIKWAETVISEVASAPKGQFNDLCDTVSAALINTRDHGLLSLGEEFRREERRKIVHRSRERGITDVRKLYDE
jgi:hypothetical protein